MFSSIKNYILVVCIITLSVCLLLLQRSYQTIQVQKTTILTYKENEEKLRNINKILDTNNTTIMTQNTNLQIKLASIKNVTVKNQEDFLPKLNTVYINYGKDDIKMD